MNEALGLYVICDHCAPSTAPSSVYLYFTTVIEPCCARIVCGRVGISVWTTWNLDVVKMTGVMVDITVADVLCGQSGCTAVRESVYCCCVCRVGYNVSCYRVCLRSLMSSLSTLRQSVLLCSLCSFLSSHCTALNTSTTRYCSVCLSVCLYLCVLVVWFDWQFHTPCRFQSSNNRPDPFPDWML